MKPINVLLVDDSKFMRDSLTLLLSDIPIIKICGSVSNGIDAIYFVKNNSVDIIIMDIEMPKLDGVETTKIIMKENPKPIILLTAADRKHKKTIEALINGAVDFIQKPGGSSRSFDLIEVKDKIIEKIKNAIITNFSRKTSGIKETSDRTISRYFNLILIGVSTGGPGTLVRILQSLPASFEIPILIVQHIREGYTSDLAESLSRNCAIPVIEVNGYSSMEKAVYIAKAGFHLELTGEGTQIKLSKSEIRSGFRPSVDVLFESASEKFKKKILGVVLTGMGNDGTDGCKKLIEKNHTVIIQDESTSIVWGMPKAVYESGFYTAMYPLEKIAQTISNLKLPPV
ncbi:MAG TPA: chemotaxis-specific protein-glutamate methyltransferase CheB [bacterium]|nr:chemotaxis-specific protein-glutamate methyltransferase CheB [bacterium]